VAEPLSRRSFLVRRLLPLLLVVGIAVWYFRDAPRDLDLVYSLGARQAGLTSLRVDVVRVSDHALARHAEYVYTADRPAPPKVRQSVRLIPGEYEAQLTLGYSAKVDRFERRFTLVREDEIDIAP